MEKIKLLVADDHHIIRDGIKSMLNKSSEIDVVAEVGSGIELLKYLDENPHSINIILMDINMPGMDGLEATKIVSEKFPSIKILCLTMHTEEKYITDMIKAGARGYILKDGNIDELIKAITTINTGKKYFSNDVSTAMINSLMNQDNSKGVSLTEREVEVLSFIADGGTNKEAGEKLFISARTVETHRRNIMEKLDLRNTAEIVKYAMRNNLIE